MALSDTKKVQTFVNACADEMATIRAAVARMDAMRTKYTAANPNVTGTPLAGNVAALNTAFTALKAESDKVIWTNLIAAKVPSHRGEAL